MREIQNLARAGELPRAADLSNTGARRRHPARIPLQRHRHAARRRREGRRRRGDVAARASTALRLTISVVFMPSACACCGWRTGSGPASVRARYRAAARISRPRSWAWARRSKRAARCMPRRRVIAGRSRCSPDNLMAAGRTGFGARPSRRPRRGTRPGAHRCWLPSLTTHRRRWSRRKRRSRCDVPADAESRMLALAQDARVNAVERSLAFSILGDARDRQGRTADAFAAYAESNRNAPCPLRARVCGRTGGAGLHARVCWHGFATIPRATCCPSVPPEVSDSPAIGHVFLLGFPRSGTTLLEQVLARIRSSPR